MPVDADPRQKARHRHGVEQAADRKARNDDTGDRKRGFAKLEQEGRDERKQSEHAAAFDKDRRIADARVRVGEDGAIALLEGRQAGPRRMLSAPRREIRRPPRSRPP